MVPQSGSTLCVVTVNICVFPAGLRNRPLGTQTLVSVLVSVAVLLVIIQPSFLTGCAMGFALPAAIAFFAGIPLARLAGFLLQAVKGYDDFKRERIRLFLEFVKQSNADVICVQECFESWLWPSGHTAALLEGARAEGFHCSTPTVDFSSWSGMNSGLLILSKIPIIQSTEHVFRSQFLLERFAVKRVALRCNLDCGLQIFTCHLTPEAENCGPIRWAGRLIQETRRGQANELSALLRQAPGPLILAGDLNLSLQFQEGKVLPSPPAEEVLERLKIGAGLTEMTAACRGDKDGLIGSFRPTCGYTGAGFEGGPPETWLSTPVGDGSPKHVAEDAILFRSSDAATSPSCLGNLRPVNLVELPMHISKERRPHECLTHITDHWAVKATFERR